MTGSTVASSSPLMASTTRWTSSIWLCFEPMRWFITTGDQSMKTCL